MCKVGQNAYIAANNAYKKKNKDITAGIIAGTITIEKAKEQLVIIEKERDNKIPTPDTHFGFTRDEILNCLINDFELSIALAPSDVV